jgi:hypothetical protein
MDTIETGIRTSLGNDQEINQIANLLHANDINHLQIVAHFPEEIDKSIGTLKKLKAPYLELSCFYQSININAQDDDLFVALNKCKEHYIKYLCTPIDVTTNLVSVGKLISTANELHVFLFFEMQVDVRDDINTFNEIRKKFASDFTLLSLNVKSLKEITGFSSILKQSRNAIGIINVFVDNQYTTHPGSADHFAKFLEGVFLLPFKQQPLIFTNPSEDLPVVYERFYDIVDEQNYWYM